MLGIGTKGRIREVEPAPAMAGRSAIFGVRRTLVLSGAICAFATASLYIDQRIGRLQRWIRSVFS
jgi:hypothetical protein